MRDIRSQHLIAGHTLNGRRILRHETSPENWSRCAISQVASNLLGCASALLDSELSWSKRWAETLRIVDALEPQILNVAHFGDFQPGLFDADGKALVPDPRCTYEDLFSYGVTGPHGYAGFLKECGLPETTDWNLVQLAIGLLLVDQAVTAIDDGQASFAAFVSQKAQSVQADIRLSILSNEAPKKIKAEIDRQLSERGRPGGKKSGEARRQKSAVQPKKVIAEAERLLATGNYSRREVNGIIGRRLGVTASWIGKIRRLAAKTNSD